MPQKIKKPRRRAKGEGAISQLKSGLWVARIEGEPDPTTGQRRRLQVTSMDHTVMLDKLAKAKADIREHGYTADPKGTVNEWTERWLAEIADSRLRGKTFSTYASLLRKHVQPVIGTRRLAQLAPADVRKVRDGIMAKGLSSTTALQCYRVLSKCMEDARRENLITQNVCDRVDAPTKAATKRGAFTVEQTRSLLDAALLLPNGSRYMAALLMGIRQSEALGLTIDAVNIAKGSARIHWQLQELQHRHGCGRRQANGIYPCGFRQGARCPTGSWRVAEGADFIPLQDRLALVEVKSKSGDRVVPLVPPMLAALRKHLDETSDQPNPHGLVWRTKAGAPIDHKSDQEGWKGLVRSVGLPDTCTTHWARHSVATMLNDAGVDTLVIGEIVGHGAAAVTAGYIHISSARAVDAMSRLDRMLTIE